MLFAGFGGRELALEGVQDVVHMPMRGGTRSLDDKEIRDLQRQAAVIGVHEAWF